MHSDYNRNITITFWELCYLDFFFEIFVPVFLQSLKASSRIAVKVRLLFYFDLADADGPIFFLQSLTSFYHFSVSVSIRVTLSFFV